jgi:hypothetical protein
MRQTPYAPEMLREQDIPGEGERERVDDTRHPGWRTIRSERSARFALVHPEHFLESLNGLLEHLPMNGDRRPHEIVPRSHKGQLGWAARSSPLALDFGQLGGGSPSPIRLGLLELDVFCS